MVGKVLFAAGRRADLFVRPPKQEGSLPILAIEPATGSTEEVAQSWIAVQGQP